MNTTTTTSSRDQPARWSNPTRSIFFGNLSYFCTADDLRAMASPFGETKKCHICRSPNGDSLFYGFVEFEDDLDVDAVVRSLNHTLFMGRILRVSYRDPNAPIESHHRAGHQSRPSVPLDKGIEVLVSFHSKQHDILLNEEFLLSYFSQFGRVADCVVKSFSRNTVNLQKKNGAKQGGYGFVVFADAPAAAHVIAQFQQRVDVTVVVPQPQRDKVGEPLPDASARTIVVTIQCHLSHASEEAMQRRQREGMSHVSAPSLPPSTMALNPAANPAALMFNAPNQPSPLSAPSLYVPMNMPGAFYVNQSPPPHHVNANAAMGHGHMNMNLNMPAAQFTQQTLSASPPQAATPPMGHMPSPVQQSQMSPDMVPQYMSQPFGGPSPHDANAAYRAQFTASPYANVPSYPPSSYPQQQWAPVPYPPMAAPRFQPPPPAMSFPSPMQPGLTYNPMTMSPSQTTQSTPQPPFVPPPTFLVAAGHSSPNNGPNGSVGHTVAGGMSFPTQMMHAAVASSQPVPHATLPQYAQQQHHYHHHHQPQHPQAQTRPPQHL